jgi:hypothetical protein
MKKYFLFLIILTSNANAFSSKINDTIQNKILFTKVLKQLNITEKDINIDLCREKVLPYSKMNTVFVIAKYIGSESERESDGFITLDEYVVIADNNSNEIICFFFEENAWTSDAVMLSNIEIDTGIYILNNQNRAFGVRVEYTGSSRPNPYNQTDLSLFVIEGKNLKRILKNFPVSKFVGEWDTNCSGEFESTDTVIDIGNEKNKGFYNLILKTKITNSKNIPIKDDCVEKKIVTHKTSKLKYRGSEYK